MRSVLSMAALLCITAPALADGVNVAVSVGQPGFFGQIVIGDAAPPPVILAQPVLVQPAPALVVLPPVYLHVPPGYEKHWEKHCAEFDACGRRVYFVRHDWYDNEYVPRYQREHGHHGHDRHEDRDDDGHHHDHGRNHDEDRDR